LNKYQDQHEILQKLDENKPLNFLLYGPPGVGKSSLIMTLASLKSWPIYVINANGLKFSNLQAALSPSRSHDDTRVRVLLFEDFDRFLQHDQIDLVMTQVLNALDGVDNTDSRTVRVFTGNDCEAIFGNPAMINRMSFRFRFSPPTREMLEKRLNQLLRACGHSKLDTDSPLLDRAIRCGINMRQWSVFSLRFVFDKSPIQSMLAGIDQLEKRV
jgi:DNA polymerase III delta prime subunit